MVQFIFRLAMPPAPPPPPCRRLGPQCRGLEVTLRVSSDLEDVRDGDHEGTWLLGHTERVTFRRVWRHQEDLFARAVLHVPCKHLVESAEGDRCAAHGFRGPVPPEPRQARDPRQLGKNRFRLVHRGRLTDLRLPAPPARKRELTVLSHNPCAEAPCRTADNTQGAACCRDLQIEIMCDRDWHELELLVRARKPPYVCKVRRERDDSIDAEVISACGYLGDDGITCTLHGRQRPDGRDAKPDLCRRWPRPTLPETLHTGCVFARPGGGGRADVRPGTLRNVVYLSANPRVNGHGRRT